ncbi:TRAP dicarboxylate transporter, DctQ subunit, unknown substrate 6 [Marinobacterium lacunae]|uniref:TRAP transporter small permease protein n=1 Tax=Marinobacterium lacunae TaxID=1232683 RepID=A0A081FZM5_9GAMM|nr:TRAP transporter small permease subunit [Marinobacterium lacunae]KEA63980.1 TRAP dicarboxylate transporter, DctQ subunit, unknown substrate 6 [Marinobacterium lacunae]
MAEYNVDLDRIEEAVAHRASAYPRTAVSDLFEGIVDFLGRYSSLIWVVLMLLIVGNVLMRYVLGTNFIALEELQWHMFAVGFMLALSYCIVHDDHVRVDVVAENLSLRTRAVIELLGIAIFFLPFCGFILTYAWPFVERSFQIGEVSAAPGGLPARWIIKSVILFAFTLMILAALARFLRVLSFLSGWPRPRPDSNT